VAVWENFGRTQIVIFKSRSYICNLKPALKGMNYYNMKQALRAVEPLLRQCNPAGVFRVFPTSHCQHPIHMATVHYKHLKRTNLYWKETVDSPQAGQPHFLTRDEFLDETRRAECRLESPSRLELWRHHPAPIGRFAPFQPRFQSHEQQRNGTYRRAR